jgi:hypothetical protein
MEAHDSNTDKIFLNQKEQMGIIGTLFLFMIQKKGLNLEQHTFGFSKAEKGISNEILDY